MGGIGASLPESCYSSAQASAKPGHSISTLGLGLATGRALDSSAVIYYPSKQLFRRNKQTFS